MAVLVGIDEAGFGPILGPMVVSSSSFSLPSHLLKANLWTILRKSIGSKRKQLAGRLLITDSKKAYSRSIGIKHLQRTVLSCLKCLDKEPTTLTQLISLLCPELLKRIGDYPWYKDAHNHHISADKADIAIASAVLADDLAANGIKLLGLRSCCLDVAFYNRMMAAVKNKANVLFTATCQLIKMAFDNFGSDNLQIMVDRQGGRIHYRRALQRMFPDMELRIVRENSVISSYELTAGSKKMRVHFVLDGDERFLPISLASMISKYLRELLIFNINRYFISFNADLRPTAGYWKDGLRFIEELKTNLPSLCFDSNQLIRCR